jgi:DNA polymerase-4
MPFYPLVGPLLRKAWTRRSALRLVSVRFSGIEEPATQLDLFASESETDAKRRKLASVLDQLNRNASGAKVKHGHQIRHGAGGHA